jgi:hypothetical protein
LPLKDEQLFKYEEQRPAIKNTAQSFKSIRSLPATKVIIQVEALQLPGNSHNTQ